MLNSGDEGKRGNFLADLRENIGDDEAIRAKIRNAFEAGEGQRGYGGSDIIPNEQYFLTTVEQGFMRDNLRRGA